MSNFLPPSSTQEVSLPTTHREYLRSDCKSLAHMVAGSSEEAALWQTRFFITLSLTQNYEYCLLYIHISYYSNTKAYSCTHHNMTARKHLAVTGLGMLSTLYEDYVNDYDTHLRKIGTTQILCADDIRLFCY